MFKEMNTRCTQTKLSDDDREKAAQRMMASAQAHHCASLRCTFLDEEEPLLNKFMLQAVTIELTCLSIEQSLKVYTLIHPSGSARTGHNLYKLYTSLPGNEVEKEKIQTTILGLVNRYANSYQFDSITEEITEEDIRECLKKHHSTYTSLRYFGLDRCYRLRKKRKIVPSEIQTLISLSGALVDITEKAMEDCGIKLLDALKKVSDEEDIYELISQ